MAGNDNVTFGFIGLGNMGSMMAHNLAVYAQSKGLPKVQIWNRTPSKIESLAVNSYCEPAGSIAELAQKCDIIHTCLANDEVAFSICREVFQARKEGLILADHSTLFPTTSATLNEEARRAGVSFMSCPVFGPPAAAKSAGLLIVLSGNEHAREKVKSYIVPTLGKAVIDCGEDTSKGALLKILGNNCILGTIELLSESFTLAEKTGFDTNIFYDFIRKCVPPCSRRQTLIRPSRAMVPSSRVGQLWQEDPGRHLLWQDGLYSPRRHEGRGVYPTPGCRDGDPDAHNRPSLEPPNNRKGYRRRVVGLERVCCWNACHRRAQAFQGRGFHIEGRSWKRGEWGVTDAAVSRPVEQQQ
jgi:3-hydroxyisobutyrate dehydrogenase-like beta-hydroxyacid dehydrogenase